MNLLIDENLPIRLGKGCAQSVIHATQLGCRLSDAQLWEEAIRRDCVLVTKDTDFFDRIMVHGSPPKIVWLRVGNMRRRDLESLFENHWPTIASLLPKSDLVEVFDDRVEALAFE